MVLIEPHAQEKDQGEQTGQWNTRLDPDVACMTVMRLGSRESDWRLCSSRSGSPQLSDPVMSTAETARARLAKQIIMEQGTGITNQRRTEDLNQGAQPEQQALQLYWTCINPPSLVLA